MERAYLPGCRRISTRISYFETRCCSSPRPATSRSSSWATFCPRARRASPARWAASKARSFAGSAGSATSSSAGTRASSRAASGLLRVARAGRRFAHGPEERRPPGGRRRRYVISPVLRDQQRARARAHVPRAGPRPGFFAWLELGDALPILSGPGPGAPSGVLPTAHEAGVHVLRTTTQGHVTPHPGLL